VDKAPRRPDARLKAQKLLASGRWKEYPH
jgi:hypothetical protein